MVVDLTWNVVKEVVGWANSARMAAKTKAQRRYANVVEHSGVLVSGVNWLNTQFVTLLRPLVYFDPTEWDAGTRGALVRDLILFADESVVVPRMRTARAALRSLLVDIRDPDVSSPASSILGYADRLFRYQRDHEDEDNRGVALREGAASVLIETAGADVYGPDSVLTTSLGDLVRLIRSADKQSGEVGLLRSLARDLTAIGEADFNSWIDELRWDGVEYEEGAEHIYRNLRERSVMAPYAAMMQAEFGRLIAAQQRVFPAMPSPAWAF